METKCFLKGVHLDFTQLTARAFFRMKCVTGVVSKKAIKTRHCTFFLFLFWTLFLLNVVFKSAAF